MAVPVTSPDADLFLPARRYASTVLTMSLTVSITSQYEKDKTWCARRGVLVECSSLGPFHGAIAVPSVTRCRCRRRRRRRGHRCAGGVRRDSSDTW